MSLPAEEKEECPFNLLENIFGIDYMQPRLENMSRFDAEVTFTLLDWKIIDKLVATTFDLDSLDKEL